MNAARYRQHAVSLSDTPIHVRLAELSELHVRVIDDKRYALVDGVLHPVRVVFPSKPA